MMGKRVTRQAFKARRDGTQDVSEQTQHYVLYQGGAHQTDADISFFDKLA